ncbi:MAG TPA: hypothetical protein PKV54_01775, partial [Microbacteriaceae bacterium]|nr:hypothetical protein [Microbacteriaceae bacterium]
AQRLIVAELVRREGVSAGVGASGAAGVERASQSTLGHTAVVAAAFAALSAARRSAAPAGLSLGDALDMAMDAVAAVRRPHSGPVVMHHGARALSD